MENILIDNSLETTILDVESKIGRMKKQDKEGTREYRDLIYIENTLKNNFYAVHNYRWENRNNPHRNNVFFDLVKRIFPIIILFFFVIMMSNVNAYLGDYNLKQCVPLLATGFNNQATSSINLSLVRYPNQTIDYNNSAMTNINNVYNFTFCKTSYEGLYHYDYLDITNNKTVQNSFTVTKKGNGIFNIDFNNTFTMILTIIIIILATLAGIFIDPSIAGGAYTIIGLFLLFGSQTIIGGIAVIMGILILIKSGGK